MYYNEDNDTVKVTEVTKTKIINNFDDIEYVGKLKKLDKNV